MYSFHPLLYFIMVWYWLVSPIYPHGYCTDTRANHIYSAGLLHMNLSSNVVTTTKQRLNNLSAYESGHEGAAVLSPSFAIKW